MEGWLRREERRRRGKVLIRKGKEEADGVLVQAATILTGFRACCV